MPKMIASERSCTRKDKARRVTTLELAIEFIGEL
jgi:hypothetical protein